MNSGSSIITNPWASAFLILIILSSQSFISIILSSLDVLDSPTGSDIFSELDIDCWVTFSGLVLLGSSSFTKLEYILLNLSRLLLP